MNTFRFLLISLIAASCSYTLPINDGPTAFERKRYTDAIPLLEKEAANAPSRAAKGKLAFQLAESYRRTGQDQPALNWYKTAYDNAYGAEALRGYAYTLKRLQRYKEAQDEFKQLGIEIGSPYEFRKEITACKVAEEWLKSSERNGFKIEIEPFNSAQNDFSPVWLPDGRVAFSSDRAAATGKEKYRWTGRQFMDIFVVEAHAASAQIFDNQINSPENEGTLCFSADGKEVFFSRATGAYKGDDRFCKIYMAYREGDAWSAPTPLPFQKDKINYLHPALSADGKTLFFSCNDPEGWGGYDLYTVLRNPESESGWTEPKAMSRAVNTPANDAFPSIDADTLYFASEGHTGMGGFDIFRTYRMDRNAWSPPINLKSPVNSGADDFGFFPQPGTKGMKGLFTSNRKNEQARGGDDIYAFERIPIPPMPKDTHTTPPVATWQMLLEGYVVEKIWSDADDPNSTVLGRKPLADSKVTVEFGGKKQTIAVGPDGYFKIELQENTDYKFTATHAGYLTNSAKFSTKGIAKDPSQPVQIFEIEIVLDKIFRDREIVLENIYYDYDKWDIRPDAEPTLNKLAEVLRQNPGIQIQLGSHTDCRGADAYNQTLSQRRAESAVNYLISKDIAAERLSAFGYGESRPAAACVCAKCTESEHQQNRRTTFKIQ